MYDKGNCKMSSSINIREGEIEILLNERIYPKDVVMVTSYIFSEKYIVDVEREGKGKLRVIIKGAKLRDKDSEEVIRSFFTLLNDTLIRHKLEKKTGKLREYILARAFFNVKSGDYDRRGRDERREYIEDRFREKEEPFSEPDEELDQILKEIEETNMEAELLDIRVPWEEKYGNKKD